MKEIKYKEYTAAENVIYYDAIEKILTSLRNGNSFKEACSGVEIEDAKLKNFIHDDAIKVMIAELHYRDGISLDEVAKRLGISVGKIVYASMEMLEDVEISASETFKKNNPNAFESYDA